MMSYRAELINKVRTRECLLNFDKPNFILELSNRAGEALLQKNMYGYLAAVLIYHQMKEEILMALLRKHNFYTQLTRPPEDVSFSTVNYQDTGYITDKNDMPYSFKNRNKIPELSKKFDYIKNEIVNRLSEGIKVEEIERMTMDARAQFEAIFAEFKENNLWFYKKIKAFEESACKI